METISFYWKLDIWRKEVAKEAACLSRKEFSSRVNCIIKAFLLNQTLYFCTVESFLALN